MNEKDRKDTYDSIEKYLATGKANSPPARPTLEKGLLYYRHGAERWLWDMNWRLRETALISIGAVRAGYLEVAERINLIVEHNNRKGEFLPRCQNVSCNPESVLPLAQRLFFW